MYEMESDACRMTVCDLEKNSGQSLMHYKLHTDRARSERSVLSLDAVV